MENEIEQIQQTNFWEVVPPSKNKNIIGVKWIYTLKLNVDGNIAKHKARLIAKGYVQKEGLDYEETFAFVARIVTIHSLLALASHFDLTVYQMDVKSAFLNG